MKFIKSLLVLAIVLFAALSLSVDQARQQPRRPRPHPTLEAPSDGPHIVADYGKLPLSFEPNAGQTDGRVKFLSRGNGYSLFLTGREVVIALNKTGPLPAETRVSQRGRSLESANHRSESEVIRMKLVGVNPSQRVIAMDKLEGKVNYFLGKDPAKWRTNLPTYAQVKYDDVYPGVDLVYYGNQGQLEYDFVVAPGADPSAIRLKFGGPEKPRLDKQGDLLFGTGNDAIRFQKPVVYQQIGGEKKLVEGSYLLASNNQIVFQLGAYDNSRPLIIDPVLQYATYLGGSDRDSGGAIATDSSGNAYVTGTTTSTNFPTTAKVVQKRYSPGVIGGNAFVSKLNTSGSALVYSTYLGGGGDTGTGIAVDGSGHAYLTGSTSSANFPTTRAAFQRSIAAQPNGTNAFVTEINASGSKLIYSTYLGGNISDTATGIAIDGSGNAYVTGTATSTTFPTANAFQGTRPNAIGSVFVSKLDPSGSALVYSTYLGGSSGENLGQSIAVDGSGDAYVTGVTVAADFPTTPFAYQRSLGGAGASNAFVTKFDPTGTALAYSTYLGGGSADQANGIALDASGNAYLTGFTYSGNFPTTPGALQTTSTCNGFRYHGVFVSKLNPSGSGLVYSTYVGPCDYNSANAIAVDNAGNASLTGLATGSNMPATPDAVQRYGSIFVTTLNSNGSALVYSTLLGGNDNGIGQGDQGTGIAVDGSANLYVTGFITSTNLPTKNAFQPTLAGGQNAFVAKF